MEYVKTRVELLYFRRLSALVEYGEDIIRKKTVLLTNRLLGRLEEYKKDMDAIKAASVAALNQIDMAIGFDGIESVIAASNMIVSNIEIDFNQENIIGALLPSIVLKNIEIKRNYSALAFSQRIDGASKRFEELVKEIILTAAVYIGAQALSDAIYKSRTRYNAIKYKLLPFVLRAQKDISTYLDELAREDNFAIKRLLAD